MRKDDRDLHESLLFLCDVQNVFYTVRDAYGMAARVDFRKLKDVAAKGRRFKHLVHRAYWAAKPGEMPTGLRDTLERLSYDIVISEICQHEDGSVSGTNIDGQLAMDATTMDVNGQDPEVVVVASGDSDYIPVYETLKERGVRVEVMSFSAALSLNLKITWV